LFTLSFGVVAVVDAGALLLAVVAVERLDGDLLEPLI
jgi:hypothetical protein